MNLGLIIGIAFGWLAIGLFIIGIIIGGNPLEALFKSSPEIKKEAWTLFVLSPLLCACFVWGLIVLIFALNAAIAIAMVIGLIYYSVLLARRVRQKFCPKLSRT